MHQAAGMARLFLFLKQHTKVSRYNGTAFSRFKYPAKQAIILFYSKAGDYSEA